MESLTRSQKMPSATYALFVVAMAERRQILCTYQGRRREICPIILGHTKGDEKALVYQVGGQSSKSMRTPADRWRCFSLADVKLASLMDGPWLAEADHKGAQSCVQDVDYDVNPESPYSPRFQL
jgi:hypothetical protein